MVIAYPPFQKRHVLRLLLHVVAATTHHLLIVDVGVRPSAQREVALRVIIHFDDVAFFAPSKVVGPELVMRVLVEIVSMR